MNWWTIFLTGLTTGGISCLAMQGGLLASAISNQKDSELVSKNKQTKAQSFDQLDWLPVSMFLVGKLISHTIFGFFLGLLGSTLELSLTTRLAFQFLAALFMFATAMNLLEVHPIFRYVVFQPPKFFTRFVRNSTKSTAVFTPALIGFLTVLIPCGVTQSMEVLAITSGNPIVGALVMAIFVLGTSPIFGLIGVGIAKFSEFWKGTFLQLAAVLLIFLTISSINGILVVLDAPVTLQKVKAAVLDPAGVIYTQQSTPTVSTDGYQELTIDILNSGYSPNKLQVKQNVPVRLTLQTKETYSCASEFILPAFNLKARLRATDTKVLEFTPDKKGRFAFSCGMGMYTGVLEVI